MSTELNQLPGDENNQQNTSAGQSREGNQEHIAISLPHTDRPEGPFEHSGEVAGWTAEEEKEKEEKQHQGHQ